MISASVTAGPLFLSTEGLVIMAGRLYVHELTPELAAQWIGVLTTIAKDSK